jgi:hypothetical protein
VGMFAPGLLLKLMKVASSAGLTACVLRRR